MTALHAALMGELDLEDAGSGSTGSLPRDDGFLFEGARDRADSGTGAFEGPEKTLEVCFTPGVGAAEGCRALARGQLDEILAEARCEILSKTSNSHLDAYVLSESSLFVYPRKVIVKTCGRTTLLRCLRTLLSIATDPAGLGLSLEWVGYSRKNYTFPDDQLGPHTTFEEELSYLRNHKREIALSEKAEKAFGGSGYVLGPVTGDHWFVYVSDQCERPAALATERTLNVMMFDLPADVRARFHLAAGEAADLRAAGRAMTERTGLKALVPAGASNLDDHAFSPCGYSMNALCFESYTTVHVTPEEACSLAAASGPPPAPGSPPARGRYASFETNTALKSYASLVKNVLAVFRPKRVVLTLFADEAGLRELPRSALFDGLPRLDINGLGTYHRADLSSLHVESDCVCMMANYALASAKPRPRVPFGAGLRAGQLHVGSLQ